MLGMLADLAPLWGPLRLFGYVTFRAAGAAATAFLIVACLGGPFAAWLRRFAKTPPRYVGLIPEEFLDKEKDKTPSMGGLLIVGGILAATLLWGDISKGLLLIFVATMLCLCGVGFLDDYSKISKRGGITGDQKLLFQFCVAMSSVFCLFVLAETRVDMCDVLLPFRKQPILTGPAGALLSYGMGVLCVVGASNAVNLTDGKDGLAAGCMVFSALAYAAIAYVTGHRIFADYLGIPYIRNAGEVVVLAAAVVGACAGFLWHNCYPASMFMGDTGSLALGGVIGLLAVLVRQELLLLLVGGVFVMEAGSVMLQVSYFKLSGGRRIFKCAPIHHHFERGGWKETQIVVRFWILAGLFALFGIASLKLR